MKPFPPIVAHCWTQKPSQGAILSNSHAISLKKKTHQVLPGLSFCGAICAKGAECWRLGKVHVSQAFSQKVFLTRWCLKRQARGASFFPPFLQVEIASLILVVSWVYWLFLEILIILYICDIRLGSLNPVRASLFTAWAGRAVLSAVNASIVFASLALQFYPFRQKT